MAHRHPVGRAGRAAFVLALVATTLATTLTACSNAEVGTASQRAPGQATPGTGGGGGGGDPAAAGPNDSPGVTDTEIRFASVGTDTNNPTGQCLLTCFDAGVKAYFAWRNEEGGLFGRQLTLTKELDDQLAQNQEKALEVISANEEFAVFNAGIFPAGYQAVYDAGIPMYVWAINFPQMNDRASIYGDRAVICVLCSSRFFPYTATVANGKKLAALGYGIADPSRDCVSSTVTSIEKYGDKTGQSMAYVNSGLDYGLPNGIAPEVTAMKAAGVDFVVTCFDLNGVKTLKQEMKRQGMGDVPVLHNDSYNPEFFATSGDLFEGDIVQTSFRPFEADAAGSQLDRFKTYMEKTGQPLSEPAVQGWVNADTAYEGIEAAGPSFTRERVIAASNELKTFTAGGMIPPIDWSRQHTMWTEQDPITHGYDPECRAFVRVRNGRFELIGDRAKPFACFDPRQPDQLTPTPTNF